jgi:hypothetical protein
MEGLPFMVFPSWISIDRNRHEETQHPPVKLTQISATFPKKAQREALRLVQLRGFFRQRSPMGIHRASPRATQQTHRSREFVFLAQRARYGLLCCPTLPRIRRRCRVSLRLTRRRTANRLYFEMFYIVAYILCNILRILCQRAGLLVFVCHRNLFFFQKDLNSRCVPRAYPLNPRRTFSLYLQ